MSNQPTACKHYRTDVLYQALQGMTCEEQGDLAPRDCFEGDLRRRCLSVHCAGLRAEKLLGLSDSFRVQKEQRCKIK